MRARQLLFLAGAAFLAACSDAPMPSSPDLQSRAASVNGPPTLQIPDRYIVVLKPTNGQVINLAPSMIPVIHCRTVRKTDPPILVQA